MISHNASITEHLQSDQARLPGIGRIILSLCAMLTVMSGETEAVN